MLELDFSRARFGQVIFWLTAIGLGELMVFGWYLIYTPQDEVASALSNIVGGIFGGVLAALAAYIAVRETLLGQANFERGKEAKELEAIRSALHTEVGMIGVQCLAEHAHWTDAIENGAWKAPDTALVSPLRIFQGVVPQIGRLKRDEVVALIQFACSLDDARNVAEAMDRELRSASNASVIDNVHKTRQPQLATLFSNACGAAAAFMRAVTGHDHERDRAFLSQLDKAFDANADERKKAQDAIFGG